MSETSDTRPCTRLVGRFECGHPEDVPLHKPAEGCTADGGRCDVPAYHHTYRPE